MSRVSSVIALVFFALPGVAMADDGGMAAPGGQAGGMAAPAEPPPAAVEAPTSTTEPAPLPETAPQPPANIAPYGEYHQGPASATTETETAGAGTETRAPDAAEPVAGWTEAEGLAAQPVQARAPELVGAGSPGPTASAGSGVAIPVWPFAALLMAGLVAAAAVLAARRASAAAGSPAHAQGLHRFA
jgi:hypothetical protein